MPDSHSVANEFLVQITAIIEDNISDEQFGVSELANEMNMSRSNLLRKIKKQTNLSVSQFINQVRLRRGMHMLKTTSLNVSEVSFQVGFGSTSYFIKCFREYHGYPPGEVGKRDVTATDPVLADKPYQKYKPYLLSLAAFIVVLVIGVLTYYFIQRPSEATSQEKSIVVLPFKNDSNDSSNVYLINGLMESTLNHLQKIKDLRVISRTSAEKYRNTSKSIPEMANELNVNYFVEGSGQKIGDQILLNIQLIDASTDRHLWARQYKRETKDIFALQQEIAKNIAEEIRAIITPEEAKRIEKNPTENLEAYDLFLKGRDLLAKGSGANLKQAIVYLKKAIELDNQFALAYAQVAITYYYLDAFMAEKKYTADINNYADRALLLDSKLAESLIAKALFYTHKKEYELAVPYLEKALEYYPNSVTVVSHLADFYCNYIPNTTRYLEYALRGVKLDNALYDSATASYNYLRMSNALIQTGFVDEALAYTNKSLDYNPQNYFSGYLKVYILLAKNKDVKQAKELMINELKKDTTRLDIMQEIGKICYLLRDYESAYHYYSKFLEMRSIQQLEMYDHESLKIAIVLSKVGRKKQSDEFLQIFKNYCDNDKTIYKHLNLAIYYSYLAETRKALDHLKLFSKEDNYQYWILFWSLDTAVDPVRDLPEFKKLMRGIEDKFWKTHKEMRGTLEDKGLL